METNKKFFVSIGVLVFLWVAGILYTHYFYFTSFPVPANEKPDDRYAKATYPIPTEEVQYLKDIRNDKPFKKREDKGFIEYILGCEFRCP